MIKVLKNCRSVHKIQFPLFEVNSSNIPIYSPDYSAKGCYLYDLVKKANNQGKFYPLWGTCLGFQLLHICANNQFATYGDLMENHLTLKSIISHQLHQ